MLRRTAPSRKRPLAVFTPQMRQLLPPADMAHPGLRQTPRVELPGAQACFPEIRRAWAREKHNLRQINRKNPQNSFQPSG